MLSNDQKQMMLAAICVAVLVAAAFFASFAGMDYSQHPIRSQQASDQEQQPTTDPPQGRTMGNQHPSLGWAVPVEVFPAPRSESESTEDQTEKNKYYEWVTAIATEWLALLTFGLVAVAVFQVGLFWQQLSIMKVSLHDTREAVSSNSLVAKATQRQADAAETILKRRERPYIFTFGVTYIKRDHTSRGSFIVEFSVANYGTMPAVIESAKIGVVVGDNDEELKIPPSLWPGHSLVASPIISAGERRDKLQVGDPDGLIRDGGGKSLIFNDDGSSESIPNVQFNVQDGSHVFLRSIISYRGPFSEDHETVATWKYDTEVRQFFPHGDTKLNYYK
jgi:hypothetical protein